MYENKMKRLKACTIIIIIHVLSSSNCQKGLKKKVAVHCLEETHQNNIDNEEFRMKTKGISLVQKGYWQENV